MDAPLTTRSLGELPDVSGWSTEKLVDYLLEHYHRPLRDELLRLEAMARKVHRVHGAKDPDRFAALFQEVMALREELEPHLLKEEEVIFPSILAHEDPHLREPLEVMRRDHQDNAQHLSRIRELTFGFVVPEGACNTWRGLWQGLEALERHLEEHIHLENNVLFPRIALPASAA